MNHAYTVEHDLVGRYVSGTLAEAERAQFEEHFMDCPECLDALEGVDDFESALRAVAAEDAAARRPRILRRSIGAAVAIAAGIVIVVGALDLLETRRELARLTAESPGRTTPGPSIEAPATSGPNPTAVSVPVFTLATVRGDVSAAPNRVSIAGDSDWTVLSLQLDQPDTGARYRATLRDASRRVLWSDDGFTTPTPDILGIRVRGSLLAAGDYVLDLERRSTDAGTWIPAGRYPFRVVR